MNWGGELEPVDWNDRFLLWNSVEIGGTLKITASFSILKRNLGERSLAPICILVYNSSALH